MNIAYLIAAHTDPIQLERLVNSLDNGKNDFYIHVDKKSDQAEFVKLLGEREHVYFVKKRVKDYWGGLSHMMTLVALLDEAIIYPHDRLVYISGLDYPVWSNERMEQFYEQNPKRQLLCGYNLTHCKDTIAPKKINHFAWWDVPIKNEKLFNKVRRKLNDFLEYIPHATSFKVDGKEWEVFWGSDWWSMSYECAKYVIDTYHAHKEIYKFFKFTFCPSELWVQTIVANSPYRNEMNFTDQFDFNIVTELELINYSDKGMYIWQEKDFDTIVEADKMFIRKTTTAVSQGLYEKIDDYRRS